MNFVCSIWVLLALGFASCRGGDLKGILHIKASGSGNFDIFKINEGDNVELIAEQRGFFNQDLALSPGSYFIHADCSSKKIIIYPDQRLVFSLHSLKFLAHQKSDSENHFRIECMQNHITQSSQVITGRFDLHLFSGPISLLVNQVSYTGDLGPDGEVTVTEVPLASLRVKMHQAQRPESKSFYFVSNMKEKVGLTNGQAQGAWQHLLPGEYVVELNATSRLVTLLANQELDIEPGLLSFLTPADLELSLAENILGTPLHVDLNMGRHMSYGVEYPVLGGDFLYRPSQYLDPLPGSLVDGEVKIIELQALALKGHCSPWDYSCLGQHQVYVYRPQAKYPMIKSPSDVPILYSPELLEFALQGAIGIRVPIPLNNKSYYHPIGQLRIEPMMQINESFVTDLVRLEQRGSSPSGAYTNDLPLDQATVLTVPVGKFDLANYLSSTRDHGFRRRSAITVEIVPSGNAVVPLTIAVSPIQFERSKKKELIDRPPPLEHGGFPPLSIF
jgi:hypothetical protein